MDKRYQVFVSSTFADLRDERQAVMSALLQLDAIPSGMELFPAADDDAWTLIEKIINDCDYYLLIIGGRYGSVDAEGISYTEKEYDYAVRVGKPVMAFLHGEPDEIPMGKSESTDALAESLDEFRTKVQSTKHCKFWTSADGLAGAVALSFSWFLREYPGEGWVRASGAMTPEMRQEVAELRLRVAEMTNQLLTAESKKTGSSDHVLDSGDSTIHVPFSFSYLSTDDLENEYGRRQSSGNDSFTVPISWNEILGGLGRSMLVEESEEALSTSLQRLVRTAAEKSDLMPSDLDSLKSISDPGLIVLEQCLLQLAGLGFVDESKRRHAVSDRSKYWTLTKSGKEAVIALEGFGESRRNRAKKAPAKKAPAKKAPAKKAPAK